MSDSNDYRVSLDVYSGPLDLLLFLIRRDEIDVYDIPIARITAQFLEYVDLLKELDPDSIGDFLVIAATLMEVKSRLLLPKPPPEEVETEFVDPRLELVQQLLEYKKFKDAARNLEDAASVRSVKHARQPVLPPRDTSEHDLENLDIWDLFEAFNKILKQIGKAGTTYKIDVDDTPIALHAEDVLDSLERKGGSQRFEDIFVGRTRGEMIGLFLALLELIRQRRVRATQERPFAPILLELLDRSPLDDVPEAGSDLGDFDAAFHSTDSREEAAEVSEVDDVEVELASVDDDDGLLLDDLGDEFALPDVPEIEAGVMTQKQADRDAIEYKPRDERSPDETPEPQASACAIEGESNELGLTVEAIARGSREPQASACADARDSETSQSSIASQQDHADETVAVCSEQEASPDETK